MRSKNEKPPSAALRLPAFGNHCLAFSLCCLLGLTATSQAVARGPDTDGDRVIEIQSGAAVRDPLSNCTTPPEEASLGLAGVPRLTCFISQNDRRRGSRTYSKSRCEFEDKSAIVTNWWAKLWRSGPAWLLSAVVLLVCSGGVRAEEPLGIDLASAESLESRRVTPAAYASRSRSMMQEDSPSSGAFDAPDVRRPYWESPNIVIEEADEFPHPRSLEVSNPNSFWYTNRPNILNIPISDEWDFYNLINTDRPDFTDAVYSVGKGVAYLETGYTFHKIDDGSTHISTRQLPESLLRYGVTNEFELRLKWNGYLMTDYKDYSQNVHLTEFGSQDIDAAFKWELIQQEGWRPMFTVVSGMLLPSGTPGTSANAVQPHFNLLWGWGLRRWLYLKVQTGCDFLHVSNSPVSTIGSVVPGFVIERSAQASWHQSCCFLTQWTKRVGAFHEWFLIQNTGSGDTRAQNFLDMGTYIYMTPNIQFDARIGKRISDRVDDVFAGAGFSARW